ncbi:hypothetical protein [Leptospira noguchii]|nr:hypothetical protein [Leptospira noguchii]
MNLILEFHNNLTRAESCLWQAGFAPIFLRRTHVKLFRICLIVC